MSCTLRMEVCGMYQTYGISKELVERVKLKMKSPAMKERVKLILEDVSKEDLQNRVKVRKLVGSVAKVLGEKLTEQQTENIVHFVVAQKIDPKNTFHLIRLWSMFR